MRVDYCLIMSAGHGTRMGRIGSVLPKPLWPIYEKTILELQIARAKELGCKKIFVNTHHLAEQINKKVAQLNDPDVVLVHEPSLLGTGGAIHNLKDLIPIKEPQSLLCLAGDQFLFFDDCYYQEAKKLIETHHAVLFGMTAHLPGYSRIVINDGKLTEIIPSKDNASNYPTYSGNCLINLARLEAKSGPSSLFESVVKFKNDPIPVITPPSYHYWDFGTSERYFNSMFSLLSQEISGTTSEPFILFCRRHGTFKPQLIDEELKSYAAGKSKAVVNLSKCKISNPRHFYAIILNASKDLEIERSGIYYDSMVEEIGLQEA